MGENNFEKTCLVFGLHFHVSVCSASAKNLNFGASVTPPTRVRTNSPSGSRTRKAGAGGGRSTKDAKAPLFEVRGARFTHSPYWHTSVTHP